MHVGQAEVSINTFTGWGDAATMLRELMRQPVPFAARLTVDGAAEAVIDFGRHAYTGSLVPGMVPPRPQSITMENWPAGDPSDLAWSVPPRDLDGLLWDVAVKAFGTSPATWRSAAESYRVTRWPNLAEVTATAEVLRVCAVLSSGFVSVDEVSSATGIERSHVDSVINCLDLVGALTVSRTAVESRDSATRRSAAPEGILSLLRKKLGF